MKTIILRIAVGFCVFLLLSAVPFSVSVHPANAPAPTVAGVSPNQAYNNQPTTITVTGADFVATPSARLGNVSLTNITFVDSATLTATVPADLPGGGYSLTVTNPDSQSASLANSFNVLWSGDGSLGPWQVMNNMTMGRYAFAAVAANRYVYAIGGTTSNRYSRSVERALINSDGTLGSWQVVNNMTIGREFLAAVAANGYLYALGGDTETIPDSRSVERALINSDGTLGSWQVVNNMTTGRPYLAAVAANGYLYALGGIGSAPGGYLSSVERAVINPDGTLGSWQVVNNMTVSRAELAAVAANGYLYALGGFDCNSGCHYWSTVERALINPDGTLGPWQVVNSMTTDRHSFAGVAASGYIYALGNYGGNTPTGVERAVMNLDGTLGSWQGVNNMTVGREGLAAVASC